MSTETKTEPEDLLQQMRLHTSMWADDRIALFKTRGNTMIAYVPSDLFKIWVVVFASATARKSASTTMFCG
jgi:hypothetical protein